MYFQIKKLILWPKKEGLTYKEIPFELGMVNVITGSSRTGKSAIIPIVDYCLGSKECAIPVNIIRDACSWFGVIIKTKDTEMLLARREPGVKKSTDDMMFVVDKEVDVPTFPQKNNNRERVCRTLDEIAKITFQSLDEDESNGFNLRPSFRDMMAFSYQPQNIIANANTLFYKADTMEHRQKLINIFPYVLGAVDGDVLGKRKRLSILEKELMKKEKELENLKRVSAKWDIEIKGWLKAAQGVGLLDKKLKFDKLTYNICLEYLEEVGEKNIDNIAVSAEGIELVAKNIIELREQERKISRELAILSNRKREMASFFNNISDYKKNLSIQRDRLEIANWISELTTGASNCPFCGSKHNNTGELQTLLENLKGIEAEADTAGEIPVAFEREFTIVNAEIKTLSEELAGVQNSLKLMEREQESKKRYGYTLEEISKFIGKAQYAKETFKSIVDDSELDKSIQVLKEEIERLQKEVNEYAIERRINKALGDIQNKIMAKLPHLDLENPYNQVKLDYKNLTLKIDNNGRLDYLWQIGSGSNWISYHLATILSMQEFAVDGFNSPLAQFIIIDQPSQVYFPRKLANSEDVDSEQKLKDEDIIAVSKMFKVMGESIKKHNQNLQVIVLEHADEEVWEGIENIHKVCEWRDGKQKLIPAEWLD